MASIGYFVTAVLAFFLYARGAGDIEPLLLLLGFYFAAKGLAHIEIMRSK